MVAPVGGFGRSVPLMAPAGSSASGGGAVRKGGKKGKSKKPPVTPVDVNALKKDVDDLKARTFKANLEGRSTIGGKQQLHFLKAEAELDNAKLTDFTETTSLGLSGKIDANSGYEDAKGLGLPSGSAPFGSLTQATEESKWFGSATLRLVNKSAVDGGYKVSAGVGFTDNKWSLDVKTETASLVDPNNSLKIYLNAALTTPTLSDPKWSKGGKIGIKYLSDQKKNPDPIVFDKADASFELLDKAGTTVSRAIVMGGVRFANNQMLEAKYTRLMIGETKSNTSLIYILPLGSAVVASFEGQYDTTEKVIQYGTPNSGVSFDGTPLPAQPSGLETGDYLSGALKFQFDVGPISPYVGFGVSKATSGVENLNSDASRFFALAGLDINKAK